jgi:hypothetical protein
MPHEPRGTYGDNAKPPVGCVPPTALLFEQFWISRQLVFGC